MFSVKLKNTLKSILCNYYHPNVARLISYTYPLKRKYYTPYNTIEFKKYLKNIDIKKGDSVFIMCSANNVYRKTGYKLPVLTLLNDLLEVIGEKGTIMALCFSNDREKILTGEKKFNIKRTHTESGILSELIRRKPGSERSMHPIFSAVAYGYKAKEYCSEHYKTHYAFDQYSPYYKITQDSGKYLGVGVGVEAYTPAHMIDDHLKDSHDYPVKYESLIRDFCVIDATEKKSVHKYYYRSNIVKGIFAPYRFFRLLKINYKNTILKSGVQVFSMSMSDYFYAGINIYNDKKISYNITGLPTYIENIYKFYRSIKSVLVKK
jgi:aminoglycoside N3'-acetyltransferase